MHELAHHVAAIYHAEKYQGRSNHPFSKKPQRPKPHGAEWKKEFRLLMAPMLLPEIFPHKILLPLTNYLKNPKASSSADEDLLRALRTFDRPTELTHLEDLPFDAIFEIKNGMRFQKKGRLRTRYTCIHLKTKRGYRISPLAEVKLVEDISPFL